MTAKMRELKIKYGSTVSLHKKGTVSLTIKCALSELSFEEAHDLFACSQLQCKLSCDASADKDVEGQQRLCDTDVILEAIAEAHGYRTTDQERSLSLSLNSSTIETDRLGMFAGRDGTLSCRKIGKATKETNTGSESEQED